MTKRLPALALVALVLWPGRVGAQVCGTQQKVLNSDFESCARYWEDGNPRCSQWDDNGNAVEMGRETLYGGTSTNHVAEVDYQPVSLAQNITSLRPLHAYVLEYEVSWRGGECPAPDPVNAIINFTNTDLPATTVQRGSPYGLVSQSLAFTTNAGATSGMLTVVPGNLNTTTCGIIFDNFHLHNWSEDTAGYTLSLNAPIGGAKTVTIGGLYPSESYTTYVTVFSADGTQSRACTANTSTSTPSGTITYTLSGGLSTGLCRTTQVGETVRVTRVLNNATTCNYPNLTLQRYILGPTDAQIASFEAVSSGEQTLLRWRSAFEADNLGFHLYREENGERVPLTPTLIPGSALQFHGGRTDQGRMYYWADQLQRRPASFAATRYILEAISMDGTRREHVAVPSAGSLQGGDAGLKTVPIKLLDPRALAHLDHRGALTEAVMTMLEQQRAIPSARLASAEAKLPHFDQGALQGPARVRPQLGWITLERPAVISRKCLLPPSPEEIRQWELAQTAAIKLYVARTGWYRIARSDLVNAGLDAKVSGADLALFRDGNAIALRLVGPPSAFSAIEFFATTLDTPSSGRAIYWLAVDPTAARRIATSRRPSPSSLAMPKTGTDVHTVEHNERTFYFAAAQNPDGDNFYSALVGADPVEQKILLGAVAPGTDWSARVDLRLRGMTAGRHRVAVELNGVTIGQSELLDREETETTLFVPPPVLASGENRLVLRAVNGATDRSALRWIRVSYRRRLVAAGDSLAFAPTDETKLAVSGFTRSDVQVFDVTNPFAVIQLNAAVSAADGGYRLVVHVPEGGPRLLWATGPEQWLVPEKIEQNAPSSWHEDHTAGLAIITAPDFLLAAERLAEHRRGQGWSVAVTKVDDLYDEFSFGHRSAEAIYCFVARARAQWSRYPTHFLLLGDTSFDPRDHLGLGAYDFVPTRPVADGELVASSDYWFLAGAAGTVGRLPVRTATEAEDAVSRIVAYDTIDPAVPWLRKMEFVSDADNEGSFDFGQPIEALVSYAARLSSSALREIQHLEVTPGTRAVARARLVAALNAGVSLVDYFGHGSVELWSGDFFDADAITALANADRLPFISSATCLSGLFEDLYSRSLAERLVIRPAGGAIGVFASSNRGAPAEHSAVNDALIRSLLAQDAYTIGQAVEQARQKGADPRFWQLIGDPSLQLKGMSRPFAADSADDCRRGTVNADLLATPAAEGMGAGSTLPGTGADGASASSSGCAVAARCSGGGLWVLGLPALVALIFRRRRSHRGV